MKKVCIIIFIVCTASCAAQVKLKHGLLLGGGGKGLVSGATNRVSNNENGINIGILSTEKYNFMIGYKVRIKPVKKRSFYDIDLLVGHRFIDCYRREVSDQTVWFVTSGPSYVYGNNSFREFSYDFLSLTMTYNYQTYKGLYVGAGLSPEYHFRMEGSVANYKDTKIDIPVIVKLGYELKFIDLSLSYRFGVTSMIDSDIVRNGRINEWRLQLFIPF